MQLHVLEGDGDKRVVQDRASQLRLVEPVARASSPPLVRCECQTCGSHVPALVLTQITSGICGTCGGCDIARLRAPDELHPDVIVTTCVSGEIIVQLTGALDVASSDAFECRVRALRLTSRDRVVLDLRHVDVIDSAGLRALLSLRNTAKRVGHRLSVIPGPPSVQRIFDLTATRGLFEWRG